MARSPSLTRWSMTSYPIVSDRTVLSGRTIGTLSCDRVSRTSAHPTTRIAAGTNLARSRMRPREEPSLRDHSEKGQRTQQRERREEEQPSFRRVHESCAKRRAHEVDQKPRQEDTQAVDRDGYWHCRQHKQGAHPSCPERHDANQNARAHERCERA